VDDTGEANAALLRKVVVGEADVDLALACAQNYNKAQSLLQNIKERSQQSRASLKRRKSFSSVNSDQR
jgi:hypothetical protein